MLSMWKVPSAMLGFCLVQYCNLPHPFPPQNLLAADCRDWTLALLHIEKVLSGSPMAFWLLSFTSIWRAAMRNGSNEDALPLMCAEAHPCTWEWLRMLPIVCFTRILGITFVIRCELSCLFPPENLSLELLGNVPGNLCMPNTHCHTWLYWGCGTASSTWETLVALLRMQIVAASTSSI